MSDRGEAWIGRTLGGRYLIGRQLGAGGMAVVHSARDRRLDRDVAVKILRTDIGYDEEYAERLHREARGLARLSHPHIVTIHDVGHASGIIFLVMELMEGDDLIDVITKRGQLGIALVLEICSQVASALAAAHDKGIVHRDIKPDNVFLVESVTGAYSKLLDFSFASLPKEMGGGPLAQERVAYGTAHYMSPEQARAEPTTWASDIYSLGVLLYELVAAKLPYDGTPAEVLESHRCAPVPRLVELGKTLPMGLSDLVEQMMQKAPAERPGSALEVAQQLSAIREGWLATLARAAVDQARAQPERDEDSETLRHMQELYEAERYTSGETVEIKYDSSWFLSREPEKGPDFAVDTAEILVPPRFDEG